MKSAHERCSRLKHQVDKDLVDLMEQCHEPEPFQLESLMDTDKESLELEPFCESSVKRKMLDGDLDEGTQIWIYHDVATNPWNPVARSNPYAHVVVYVGSQKKKGETNNTMDSNPLAINQPLKSSNVSGFWFGNITDLLPVYRCEHNSITSMSVW